MSTRARFTLLPLMHWIAVLFLVASATLALSGLMSLPAALSGATVLTFLLKTLVEHAGRAFIAARYLVAACFGAAALLMISVTAALSAATMYATVFAIPSAVSDFTARREPLERELQRALALADTAQKAMADWAQDAHAKALQEGAVGGGGSCPNLPDTGGMRGPVAKWREDDSTIASSLAAELKLLIDTARSSTSALVALPKPADFAAVKAGYAAANLASDHMTPLTAGGHYTTETVRLLEGRRISQIERGGQATTSCGDSARLTFIERATGALNALGAVKPMPRLQPGVDVSDRHEVLARSLLRSFNGVLAMVTAGHAGSFNGDRLMQEALKQHGVVNMETLAILISLLAELAVIGTALLMVRQGQAPYADNAVTWIDADEQAHPQASTGRRFARGLAKRLANLLYVQAPDGPPPHPGANLAPASNGSPTTSGLIQLPDDPRLSREREAEWSASLLAHHVPWGDTDYLFIPVNPEHAPVAHKARALHYLGQAMLVSNAAPAHILDEPEVTTHLVHAHGPHWRQHRYQVFQLAPAYAQLMRLRAITGQAAPLPVGTPPTLGASAPRRHQPLSHRLAQRPWLRRSARA